MDRVIQKKKWTTRKILTIAGIAAIVLLIAGSIYFTSGGNKLNVDTERITISEVTKGKFQENIPVNGVVLPQTTIYLDAVEGGRVEEKYVDDGTMMKKGDPILRLSNTDLMMNMMTQQNQVYNTLTQIQINNNAALQNTVSKQTAMADVESEFREAERLYILNKDLYAKKAIGSQEFKKSEISYNYYLQKRRLNEQILQQDSISREQQAEQNRQSYKGSKEALAIMQKKVGDLIVRAPVDGQLTSLDAEVGQNKNQGERLGQIDVMGGYKVRVDVDEHYISRIYTGLHGTFSFADSDYVLEIKKVFTQVTNGRFQVDMEFVGKVPKGIRRGQTLQILLALSDERTALLLPQGGFYQQTGGNWIFKVSADGSRAYRVDIQLGNKNTDYYEVLSGLQAGDKVVTSSYENYGTDMQELVLKGK
ncbi:efflux RND transporter periplasmic adaptor subunit [Parafilimonas sp.]|uniref:efflux RND transporter periplasmic adaptor subunit n=1 Tax=Parafilimonas sp. TaxID=1969739 RepID=UPI0039E625D9